MSKRERGEGNQRNEIRYLSLFSGCGGMDLGFERSCGDASVKVVRVGHREIDPKAEQIYGRHFYGSRALGDVRALPGAYPDLQCDVIIGGFPCQNHSCAGNRTGLLGEHGRLFWGLQACIAAYSPEAFLLENVDNLAKIDGGRTLERIADALSATGYTVQYQILDSAGFGVA